MLSGWVNTDGTFDWCVSGSNRAVEQNNYSREGSGHNSLQSALKLLDETTDIQTTIIVESSSKTSMPLHATCRRFIINFHATINEW